MKILESHIEKAATDFLLADGWRSFKMEQNFSERKRKVTGEAGMPDRLYIRYLKRENEAISSAWRLGHTDARNRAEVDLMLIEWKRPKGKAAPHQRAWIDAERGRGALVLLAGEDFPATIEGFQEWYRSSGLMRRALFLTGGRRK